MDNMFTVFLPAAKTKWSSPQCFGAFYHVVLFTLMLGNLPVNHSLKSKCSSIDHYRVNVAKQVMLLK